MDFQTPYGGRNRMKFTKSEYAKGILGTLLLFAIIVGYAFEIRHFSNTFKIESLLFSAVGVGFVIGLLLGFYFSKNIKNSLEKFQVIVALVFAGLIVTPLLMEQQVYSQSRFGQLEGQMKPDGYYLFFYKNRKLERVKTKQLLFPQNTLKGFMVEIPIKKGGLGYEYFVEPKQ